MKLKILVPALLLASFFLSSCEKEDPQIPNEEEIITTVTYTLTPDGGGTPLVLSFQDLDGDGGNSPILTVDTLAANTSYSGVLQVLNEQVSPADDITTEILDEAEDHQFFFQITIDGVNIDYTDQDANGNPIGLNTTLTTGNAGSGTISVILKHEPNKSAAGVTAGDVTNAGGETDIQVTYDVNVQ